MARQKITTPEIIGIAINMFRNNGYHGTSMAMLASACGLMKGSFYNHFSSKEEILVVAIKSLNDYLNERVFNIAYDENIKPKKRLELILEKLMVVLRSDKGGCLVGNMTLEVYNSQPEFRECLNKYFEDWINAFRFVFQQKYDENKANNLAKISVQEFEGAIMLGRIFDDEALINQVVKNIADKY